MLRFSPLPLSSKTCGPKYASAPSPTTPPPPSDAAPALGLFSAGVAGVLGLVAVSLSSCSTLLAALVVTHPVAVALIFGLSWLLHMLVAVGLCFGSFWLIRRWVRAS